MRCDTGNYTAAGVVARLRAGTLALQDLYAYAGYSERSHLVRGAQV